MPQNHIVVFVCEHGAAKSIIAATYFNKLASQKNLDIHAVARATHPDEELSLKTITGLRTDGLTPSEATPQQLSRADIDSGQQIITFCELPEEYQNKATIEYWERVPPVSENYEIARDEIIRRLHQLMNNMQSITTKGA